MREKYTGSMKYLVGVTMSNNAASGPSFLNREA